MKTSIIIPTYNNEEYTIRCVNSIGLHTSDYIILWIDDASSKDSVEAVRRFLDEQSIPYELIAKDENSGFAKSVNLGLARALELESEYIVIQNNDTEVYENWLDRMIDAVNSDPRIGAAGPVTSPCESWQSIDYLRTEFDQFDNLPEYEDDPPGYAKQLAEIYANQQMMVYKRLAFFSVLFRAEVVRQIGMLSEEYGIGFGEDDDYMLRLRQRGYFGTLAKDVFVFHNHNTTFKNKYSEKEIREMREHNREILYKKFNKGRYRPKDINQVWDVEEVIAYAQQLEESLQQNKELLAKKEREFREKSAQLEVVRKQLQGNQKQLQEKVEQITEKNGKIGELNFYLNKQDEQITSIEKQLLKTEQQVDGMQQQINEQNEKLALSRLQLDNVHQSLSWRITVPLRKISMLLKKQ